MINSNEDNAWIKDVKDTIADIEQKIGTTDSDKSVYYVNGGGNYYVETIKLCGYGKSKTKEEVKENGNVF